MEKTPLRIDWIDYSKGIGIILVVYGHVIVGVNAMGIEIPKDVYYYSYNIVYSFHMALFFFLSGFNTDASLADKGTFKFITNKVKIILYPYFIWSIITGGIQIILSNYVNSDISYLDLLKTIYSPLPNQHYWFLYVLFVMFLLYAISCEILKSYSSFLLIIFSAIPFFFQIHSPIRVVDKFYINFIFFMIGIVCKQHFSKLKFNRFISLYCIVFTCGVFIVLQFIYWGNYIQHNIIIDFLLSITGIVIVFSISRYHEIKNRFVLIKRIGFYSFPIYLAHGLFGSGIRIILYKLFKISDPCTHIITGVLFGLFCPILLYIVCKKIELPYMFEFKSYKKIDRAKSHIYYRP